jgi:ribosomal protein S18 acetylase RimI-like enzyme
MMLRAATLLHLEEVASWITTRRDCELWAGWRVLFPIDSGSLPVAIEFADTNAFSLIDADELVAFGQLVRKSSTRGHLARLIVNPSVRGRGYGEMLVSALLERAHWESFECVSLNVDDSNLPAVSLYLKLGFVDATRPADEPESPGTRYMESAIPTAFAAGATTSPPQLKRRR